MEQQVEKYLRQGLTREEAARRTRLQFGGLGHVKENCRESRGVSLLQTTVQDIRSALRQLKRSPAFTTTVLLTLALGIGANAAIFTLVNAVLLKSLPVTDPKTLIRLGDTNDCCVGSGLRDSHSFFSTDQYEQLKKGTSEFEELAAMQAGFGHRPVTGPAFRAIGATFALLASTAWIIERVFNLETPIDTIIGAIATHALGLALALFVASVACSLLLPKRIR